MFKNLRKNINIFSNIGGLLSFLMIWGFLLTYVENTLSLTVQIMNRLYSFQSPGTKDQQSSPEKICGILLTYVENTLSLIVQIMNKLYSFQPPGTKDKQSSPDKPLITTDSLPHRNLYHRSIYPIKIYSRNRNKILPYMRRQTPRILRKKPLSLARVNYFT